MPLGVPAVDTSSSYSGGDPSNARSLWCFIDNALRHQFTLFPALSVGPNPSSPDPRRPLENILTPQPQEPGGFLGGFVFSTSTDRGYTFANPATGGNYTLSVDGTVVDVRTTTPSTFVSGGTAAARLIESKLVASAHGDAATFTVSYSLTTRKFTVANSAGPFDMEVKATTDATSLLHSIGFVSNSDYTGAATYTGEEARFHTDDWLVMRVDPAISGPNGSGAAFARWRWLYMVECNFEGNDYLSHPIGSNLRLDLATTGVINVDISAVSTSTSITTYCAAVQALIRAASPGDLVSVTWNATLGRVRVDNNGDGVNLIVGADADTAWPVLGFTANASFGILPATADSPPTTFYERGRMTAYIADAVADLTQQPDSAFTEGVDMFDLSGQIGTIFDATANPSWRGRSSGGQWRRGGAESLRSRYWLWDLADVIGSSPTEIYLRIKIVDPNRTTPLTIGGLGASAGWWPYYNADASTLDAQDRSTLAESVGGSLLPTFEEPRHAAKYSFGQGNPLIAEDASLLKSLLRAELDGARVTDWILGNAQPCVILDPDRVEVPSGNASAAGLAYGMAYGFLTRSPLTEYDGANRFSSCELSFVEAL